MHSLRYILALDESGQTSIRDPGTSRYGFIEGGFVVREDRADDLHAEVDRIKVAFLERTDSELKSHGLATAVGAIGTAAQFESALALVSGVFRNCHAVLAGAFLDKGRFLGWSSGGLIEATARGGIRINQKLLFETIALLFGNFLGKKGARGSIVHDQLGGTRVEDEWMDSFHALQEQYPQACGRIDSLVFTKSHESRLVQFADISIGLLREHFERRTVPRDGAARMIAEATRCGLLLNVQ